MTSNEEVATTSINPNKTIYTLCGVQGCCPTVTVDRERKMLVITDDGGGRVQLTEEQWKIAVQNVTI